MVRATLIKAIPLLPFSKVMQPGIKCGAPKVMPYRLELRTHLLLGGGIGQVAYFLFASVFLVMKQDSSSRRVHQVISQNGDYYILINLTCAEHRNVQEWVENFWFFISPSSFRIGVRFSLCWVLLRPSTLCPSLQHNLASYAQI